MLVATINNNNLPIIEMKTCKYMEIMNLEWEI